MHCCALSTGLKLSRIDVYVPARRFQPRHTPHTQTHTFSGDVLNLSFGSGRRSGVNAPE